jgi:hypothetical protein
MAEPDRTALLAHGDAVSQDQKHRERTAVTATRVRCRATTVEKDMVHHMMDRDENLKASRRVGGSVAIEANAGEASEAEWEGWRRTANGWAYLSFGSIVESPNGTWIARTPRGRELASAANVRVAQNVIYYRALRIAKYGFAGSTVSVAGNLCLSIAPVVAATNWALGAVALAVFLASSVMPIGKMSRVRTALKAGISAAGVTRFGAGFDMMARSLGVDWSAIGWSNDATKSLFIVGIVGVIGGRWVARRVEQICTEDALEG